MDIEVLSLDRLRFSDGSPVRSASAIVPFGDGFLVVQDDATHGAWFREDWRTVGGRVVAALRIPLRP